MKLSNKNLSSIKVVNHPSIVVNPPKPLMEKKTFKSSKNKK